MSKYAISAENHAEIQKTYIIFALCFSWY